MQSCSVVMMIIRRVEHFGNIRGKNSFRNCTTIYQIGLNRWQDIGYELFEMAYDFFDHDHDKTLYQMMVDPSPFVSKCTCHELIAELEQNIFRGTIRNSNNVENYHYYLFIPFRGNEALLTAIEKRYTSLGAHVVYEEPVCRKTFKDYLDQYGNNSDGMTNAAKVIRYHESLNDGDAYTSKDIMEGTGLTINQLNKVRENVSIKEALRDEESDKCSIPKVYIKSGSWLDLEFCTK